MALVAAAGMLPLGGATAWAAPEPGALSVTADERAVDADAAIGFTLSVVGPGAQGAVLVSDLPPGKDVRWRIDRATGNGCALSGAATRQVLRCDLGQLAPRATLAVHVVSGTTVSSCGTYTVRGTVRAAQRPAVTRSAATEVRCLGIAPESVGPGSTGSGSVGPGSTGSGSVGSDSVGPGSVASNSAEPSSAKPGSAGGDNPGRVAPGAPAASRSAHTALADTAAGPVGKELGWMVVLFVVGGLMVAVGVWTGRGRRTP